jgi:pimeloyl-ACP methyl ester carboxylesterase
VADVRKTVELHYEECGQGMPVVLLHGFPFDHHIWQAQQDALGSAYRVIAPDLRGHGQSPAPAGDYGMDLMAGDVVALLDRLRIERAAWVGHSMGGYIVMAALRLAPERIGGVGLVATQPFADTPERRTQRLQSADSVLQHGSEEVARSMIEVLFAPQIPVTAPLAQSMYAMMAKTPPLGMAGALRGMANRPDSTETLAHVGVLLAVIAGASDQIIKPEIVEKMMSTLPHAALTWIQGAGHMLMVEKPADTTAALRRFLESLGSG